MEKFENQKEEEKTKEVIEGVIGEYEDNWHKKLPAGIKKEEVDLFLGKDGLWHWHLKPEFIADADERKKYVEEKDTWSSGK
ncbi:MAG: hypothetical protein V1845_00640 [bacterium]